MVKIEKITETTATIILIGSAVLKNQAKIHICLKSSEVVALVRVDDVGAELTTHELNEGVNDLYFEVKTENENYLFNY